MRTLLTESFDRFARYENLWEFRRTLGDSPIRILDVGDPYGLIGRLFPRDSTVSADFFADLPGPLLQHSHIHASGLELPFADATFDIVASHDAFEHVPDDRRIAFLDELLRVSRGPIVLVAPFYDPRTDLCERLVNSFYVARIGHSLDPLDEHAQCGLPRLDEIVTYARSRGDDIAVFGDGWLYHWLPLMLVKGHLVSRGESTLESRIDAACNRVLRDRDRRGPFYRRAVFLRCGDGPDLPGRLDISTLTETDSGIEERALVDLATEIIQTLARHEEIDRRTSALRAWAQEHAAGPVDDARSEVARSMELIFAALDDDAIVTAIPDTQPARGAVHSQTPRVAVVIVNLDGADHLPECLDSLSRQSYPDDLLDVIVVDNGSTDESLSMLSNRYPWVRVLAQPHNLGFAPAVTIGVQAAEAAECIALLNNDMRVDEDWVAQLVAAYRPAERIVCVAGQILDWDGANLDFGEGTLNFGGMGGQIGFGRPVQDVHIEDGQELLFACGGSMLVSRAVFLDSGGFDDGFFAYFEDTDFGWRLQILGFRTVLAARARSYHRHHGTSARFPYHERILLYERNALRSIIKNYDDDNLRAALGPALLLLVRRAVLRGGLNRAEYEIGANQDDHSLVPRIAVAHLFAVNDVLEGWERLIEQRRAIQAARRRSDTEIIERFGRPLTPVIDDDRYLSTHHRLLTSFGLDTRFGTERAFRLLIISADEIGDKMRGPAIRAWEMAKALAGSTDVMVASPARTELVAPGITTHTYSSGADLVALARVADVVILQGYTLRNYPELSRTDAVLVVDLYDPWLFENLEIHGLHGDADYALRTDVDVQIELIDNGDFFICASERQRDYWIGVLTARNRIDSGTYARDPTLRNLIDVVPFGLESRAPRYRERVLKGVHPEVATSDLVVLWGGGTWDWFDPVTVVEAFAAVVTDVPNAKLYFLGLQLAGPNVADMQVARAVVQRAEQLGLAGSAVIFGDWTPYELRESFLLEADVAVSAARDIAETRLAFRSRLLDYFWAGLPVVTTDGDVLADEVRRHGLGVVVPPGDRQQMAAALISLLTNRSLREECGARALELAQMYTWDRAVAPLRRVIQAPWEWQTSRGLRGRRIPATEDARALLDSYRRQLAHTREQLAASEARTESLERSVAHVEGLERSLAHYERRMSQLRRSPLYALFKAARRLRQRGQIRPGESASTSSVPEDRV